MATDSNTSTDPVRSLTKSTNITSLKEDNKVSHCGSLRERQCILGALSEGSLGPEAVASGPWGGLGQQAFGSDIPADWAYVKLDLFDNSTAQQLARRDRRLRLSLAVRPTSTDQWVYLRAAVNSPWRHVRRGLDMSDPEDLAHYRVLENTRDEFVDAGLVPRSGKFYQKGTRGKGEFAIGLSGIVAELPRDHEYITAVIYQDRVYHYHLRGHTLTAAQRQGGVIATSEQRTRRRLRAKDLFR